MTKISKFILFFFVSLCLACLIASQVNALSYDYKLLNEYFFNNAGIDANINLSSNNTDINTGYYNYSINFDNAIENPTGNFLRFNYASSVVNTIYTQENINYQETCTHRVDPSADFTVTFNDGTTATINRRIYQTICDNHNISGSINNYNLDFNDITYQVYLVGNSNWSQCEIDNGYILCPLTNSTRYTGIRIVYYHFKNNYYGNITQNLKIANSAWTIDSSTQAIINNQNQNTSTINNNISDINNSINNSDISGNNSSDSISSISNSFSSSNDFILNLFTLPYNFITTIMNGVTDSCTPISLGTIFDYELVMPCINLNNWLGNVWTSIVDVVLAGMLSFAFRKRIHDFFFAIIRLDRNAANIGGVEIL